ncbi:transglycosylase family protein [Saccharopolyspora sp. HNM0983]|uniref:Transglycosylase family protein n=1 Tax=Saccharopolyspora montiporae TaxID=2781240 RepID=A0A929B860_9PSEU|nr:transglycosylase family protein [Saccharopolyspora sp. HNM0983]MBE9374041.1 transglycosylase family protein [Saccharopolyspora sp. HNM0983]
MARYKGKHRKPSSTGRSAARVAVAGAVIAAPIAITAPVASAADWDALAECESSGDWSINSGNGYYGGLQFSESTWSAFGGDQYASSAHEASREQQISVAEKVLEAQGSNAWPGCSAKTDWASGSTSVSAEGSTGASGQESAQQEDSSAQSAPQASVQAEGGDYTVQNGDTLSKIGEKFGVDFNDIFESNSGVLDSPDKIFPGQQLEIR